MRRTRVLIADDEEVIQRLLQDALEAEGYETIGATDGAETLNLITREAPDLVILDLSMPRLDGIEVLKQCRQYSQIPVIVLSAREEMPVKVKCLDLGADDYITKPFSIDELLSRMRVLFRRIKTERKPGQRMNFNDGYLKIDYTARRVTVDGQEIELTPTEYDLLKTMVARAGQVIGYESLLSNVWGPEYEGARGYLHNYVNSLRKKIEPDPRHPRYIKNLSRVGYRFDIAQ